MHVSEKVVDERVITRHSEWFRFRRKCCLVADNNHRICMSVAVALCKSRSSLQLRIDFAFRIKLK